MPHTQAPIQGVHQVNRSEGNAQAEDKVIKHIFYFAPYNAISGRGILSQTPKTTWGNQSNGDGGRQGYPVAVAHYPQAECNIMMVSGGDKADIVKEQAEEEKAADQQQQGPVFL